MATNLTLMQQFLTLFYHILAKWHSFAHSGMWDWQIKKITFIHSLILIWTIKKILRAGQHITLSVCSGVGKDSHVKYETGFWFGLAYIHDDDDSLPFAWVLKYKLILIL